MFLLKRYFILLYLLLPTINTYAQNLTGTWEGALGNDQFLQLNIIQTGDKICGYTYDHVKANNGSFCKAFFEGRFDRNRKTLSINGKYFLKNSGSHTLMKLNLDYGMEDGLEILGQNPYTASQAFEDPFFKQLDSLFSKMQSFFGNGESIDSSDYVHLTKVADQPYELTELMQDCIAPDKKKTDTVTRGITQPKDSLQEIVKTIPVEKPKDSIPAIVRVPVDVKKDRVSVPKTVHERKNTEQSIIVNTKTINLKVYDNAIVDGDTVSILYNGKMLLTHQRLTEKAIEINLELDEKQSRHELTLFAENLGSIPPNTALIIITAGDKRYELFAKASLEENAVLVFDYKPK